MRSIALLTLALGAALALPLSAQAESHMHHKSMSVQLADGRTLTFHLMKMHGRMMAVIPAEVLNPGWAGGH